MELARKTHLLLVLLTACLIAAANFAVAQDQLFVEPGLENRINSGEEVDLLVRFRGMPDLSPAYGMDWEERGRWVYEQLDAAVKRQQQSVQRQFRADGVRYQSLRLGNMMVVHKAGTQAFNSLLSAPEVQAINAYPDFQIIPEDKASGPAPKGGGAPVTNLEQIMATDAWDQFGAEGQGIVIGLNDSSPRHTHELMVNSYRGNTGSGFDHDYNFFDPSGGNQSPIADFHGTLVTSIMVGDDGTTRTGVAPGANWIACQGCEGTGCAEVIQCLDWMIAPTDVNGNNPDPDKRANVVNNSWGSCEQTYSGGLYEPIWDSMYAAGVIPYSSNGNASNCGYSSPPGLNTVGNPARGGRVMGIGSTTINGTLGEYATHSNWGPTDNDNPGLAGGSFDHFGFPDLKPNVVAPGQNVPGAGSGSDTATTTSTGTSFASPHVTGAAAVMMSAAPCLVGDHVTINSILMDTATPVPYDGGPDNADAAPGVNHPNYATGWGEINLLAATQAAIASCGPTGTLRGTVTDQSTTPLGDVTVIATDQTSGDDFSQVTGEDGEYVFNNAPEGTYDIEFVAYGFSMATATDVEVVNNQTTIQDVQMTAQPEYTISGTVTDSSTGWPLHAEISVDGFPGGSVFTDPSDGSYSIDLPGGMEHEMTVTSLNGGYDAGVRTIGPLTADQTETFLLQVDLVACEAPGYTSQNIVFVDETFDAEALPSGWTNDDLAGSGQVWEFDDPGARGNVTGGSGGFAIVDSDNYGFGASQDTALITPTLDLSSVTDAELSFAFDFRLFGGATAEVDVSIDGGTTWSNEWLQDTELRGPAVETISLASYAGQSDVRIRFRYQASFDWWWQVDDVNVSEVGATCAAMPGELVTGNVLDANNGDGINDATVDVIGGDSTMTSTSADPAFGDGTYHISVPDGAQDIEASKTAYVTDSFSDTFVDGNARIVDFSLGAGSLSATPTALSRSVTFGQTDTGPLILINEGSADVTFSLDFLAVSEDFESAFPPSGWDVVNNGGDCVWLTNDDYNQPNFAGDDGLSATADSDACGSGTTMDTSLVSPAFTPNAGSALEFVMSFRPLGSSRLDVDVSDDGGSNWSSLDSYNTNISPSGPGTQQSIDLSGFAGTPVQVRFRYVSPGWNWWTQVDQIRVLGDVDWVAATPDNGTFAEGKNGVIPQFESFPIDVNYDAGAASITEPGEYSTTLLVGNDTPGGDIEVPLTMNVEPSANQARMAGTVSSTGYCDGQSNLVPSAGVEIVGQNNTFNVTTDANGEFAQWMDVSEAPLAVSASAPDHEAETLGGVPLTGTETTNRSLELRLIAPCPSADPASVALTMSPDATDVVDVDIVNSGAGDFDWSVEETTPPVAASSSGMAPDAELTTQNTAAESMQALSGGSLPTVDNFVAGGAAIDCDFAPGLVIADDGSIENGYSGNPAAASEVELVQGFLAPGDGLLRNVCVSFLSVGPTEVDYEVVVYATDGPDATPGTELGALSGTATGLPNGLPASPAWYSLDLSALEIELSDGEGVYIGVRWAPSDPNVFAAADESEGTSPQVGFFRTDAGEWSTIGSLFAEYRSLLVRPQIDVSGCASPEAVSWITGITPASGSVAADSAETVSVSVDTTGLSGGVYSANLCLTTNDPEQPLIVVPFGVTVFGDLLFEDRFEQ